MLDKTDLAIIELLKANCKVHLRDIGEAIHLTGQAVANRISRMESLGVIKGYTALIDEELLGKTLTAYVTVFMKTTDHKTFQIFIKDNSSVVEAYRISGDGCYMLKIQVNSQIELNLFLDSILQYGNFRINIGIGKIK
ncbi:Lrp/AsnC family transcriptional regulator [Desulfosporosinus sp. FKA]|uniref:Lrp/AsnC family transcriptional regulator n=1 Tax=Desulfosporosinus sp. FKA TaxID=1969834 RepID=UPI000B49D9BC|nr:Lrp/AsnC family transcriptional regulator [Desulfosporosinus sp. FKA]